MLKECGPCEFVPALLRIIGGQTKIEPVDKRETISGLVNKWQSIDGQKMRQVMKDLPHAYEKLSDGTRVSTRLPKPLYNRRDDRYDVDLSKENKCQKKLMTIPNRLGNVAIKYAGFVTDGKKISMNCKNMDRTKNSLLPFTQMNSTYQFEGIDHQHDV